MPPIHSPGIFQVTRILGKRSFKMIQIESNEEMFENAFHQETFQFKGCQFSGAHQRTFSTLVPYQLKHFEGWLTDCGGSGVVEANLGK